jgi:hypothetical protein
MDSYCEKRSPVICRVGTGEKILNVSRGYASGFFAHPALQLTGAHFSRHGAIFQQPAGAYG